MEGGGSVHGYLKVRVGLPVVSSVVYGDVDRLSCCCLPHLYRATHTEIQKALFDKKNVLYQIKSLCF